MMGCELWSFSRVFKDIAAIMMFDPLDKAGESMLLSYWFLKVWTETACSLHTHASFLFYFALKKPRLLINLKCSEELLLFFFKLAALLSHSTLTCELFWH